jgi:hypothetical protein
VLSQLRKDLGEVGNQISGLPRFDHNVIDICRDNASYQFPENMSYASLERGARVLSPKGIVL